MGLGLEAVNLGLCSGRLVRHVERHRRRRRWWWGTVVVGGSGRGGGRGGESESLEGRERRKRALYLSDLRRSQALALRCPPHKIIPLADSAPSSSPVLVPSPTRPAHRPGRRRDPLRATPRSVEERRLTPNSLSPHVPRIVWGKQPSRSHWPLHVRTTHSLSLRSPSTTPSLADGDGDEEERNSGTAK